MNNEKILDISWGTIFKFALIGLSIYFLYVIRDILMWFVFALIISLLFNPVIDFLQSKRVPRIISVILVYLGIFGVLGLLFWLIVPVFISEIRQFSQFFSEYFNKLAPVLKALGFQTFENFDSFIQSLSGSLEKISSNIFSAFITIFGGLFSTFFVLSVAIFISAEEKLIEKALKFLFPLKYENFVFSLWERCQKKISGWFLIKILGWIFVGLFSYLAFIVFSVKYPLGLALTAGIFNFILIEILPVRG